MLKGLSGGATAGSIPGLTTGSAVTAGSIGELITSTLAPGSGVSPGVVGSAITVVSISVTAGVWDISGQVDLLASGGSIVGLSELAASLSLTTNVLGTQAAGGGLGSSAIAQIINALAALYTVGNTSVINQAIGPVAFLTGSTQTVYLVTAVFATSGTPLAGGTIRARRVG